MSIFFKGYKSKKKKCIFLLKHYLMFFETTFYRLNCHFEHLDIILFKVFLKILIFRKRCRSKYKLTSHTYQNGKTLSIN